MEVIGGVTEIAKGRKCVVVPGSLDRDGLADPPGAEGPDVLPDCMSLEISVRDSMSRVRRDTWCS